MLARSSSAPISAALFLHSPESSPSVQSSCPIRRTRSICFTVSSCSIEKSSAMMSRASSESDLKNYVVETKRLDAQSLVEEGSGSNTSFGRLFSSSGLDEECEIEVKDIHSGGTEDGGGRISGGGNGGSGREGGGKNSWFFGNDGAEEYYLSMIEANPGSALVLGNYARFLKEVKGDHQKAEEYCSRAILANPNDGSLLSFYAQLIWGSGKDPSRVERYYNQAVQAAPDDSYVLASYAGFLWDAEEEEGEEEEQKETVHQSSSSSSIPYNKYFGAVSSSPYPIAASS